MKPPKTRSIGTDRVELHDDHLLVFSRVDMEGWDVRRHRSSLIRFDDSTWRVTRKTTGADKMIQYTLAPWSPIDEEVTGPEIEYNPDYVAFRDQAVGLGRRHGRVVLLVRLLTPLAGFLPARTRLRLEAAYGLDPVNSAFQSVIVEFFIGLVTLVLFLLNLFSRTSVTGPLLVTVLVLASDAAVRWHHITAEERPLPGFCEWLFRRRAP